VTGLDGVSVLWGPPGRGKSTYLSHCFDQFEAAKQICIRHHYFLSLQDRGHARFFLHEIEESLIRQLEDRMPGLQAGPRDLDHWLDAAAQYAGARGCRLIVMLDGLDHVWREGRSLEHMHQLFATVLPPRPNMHVVVGTQKIAAKNLPHRLLQICPEEGWHALPLMSGHAIGHWLSVQHEAERLTLQEGGNPPEALSELTSAFHKLTGGLPLHLIYAFEMLTRPGGVLTAERVYALPPSPYGDIREYYAGLWMRISASARDILHAIASIDFPMPPDGLRQCFHGLAGIAEAIEEIDHLLDHRETGSFPFHGSIFVFVREQDGHAAAAAALRPAILAWLAGPAPAYWKWAWTWITQARFGDPQLLADEPNREWAIAALCAGQPPKQIEHILQDSEEIAFKALNFARAAELRALWARLSNAPQFQTHKFAEFVEGTLRATDNDYRLVELRSDLAEQVPETMLALLRALDPPAALVAGNRVLDELNRRVRDSRQQDYNNIDWPSLLVRTLPYIEIEPKRLRRFAKQQGRPDDLIGAAAEEALLTRRYGVALQFAGIHRGVRCDASLFRVLCLDGADPRGLPGQQARLAQPIFQALHAVRKWPLRARASGRVNVTRFVPSDRGYEAQGSTGPRLRSFFFRVLAGALGGRSAQVRLAGLDQVGDAWVRDVLEQIARVALEAAIRLDHGTALFTLCELYDWIAIPPRDTSNYDTHSVWIGVRLGVRDLAIDLQLLRRAADPALHIEAADLPDESNPLWLDALWLGYFAEHRLALHTPQAAEALLERVAAALGTTVQEFNERSNVWIDAATFALDHGLTVRAQACLDHAARCLMGYGWHKDVQAFELLEALEHLAAHDKGWAAAQILRLAPALDAITDYTDGDETNHARSTFYDLVADLLPDRTGPLYRTLTLSQDYRYAEELLTHVSKSLDPTNPHDQALLATFLQPIEFHDALTVAKGKGRAGARLIASLKQRIGYSRPAPEEDRGSSTDSRKRRRKRMPVPADYPPPMLLDFRAAVQTATGETWRDGATERWLNHWHAAERGLDALAALRGLLDADHFSYEIEQGYDTAFEISLALQGRQEAFFWLVEAQRHRHGWHRWYTSSAEAERRLELAATHYRDRWQDFILESAKPVLRTNGERSVFVLGHSRLVQFLLQVGEIERARALVETLIATQIAEVEDQPLTIPGWVA